MSARWPWATRSGDANADQPYDRAVMTPEILRSSPLAEEILESHRHRAHGDDAGYDAYKAHVYRVVNFARALAPDEPDRDDKLAIAAAFHDLAVFDTLDYLVPSIEAQDAWLQQTGREGGQTSWRSSSPSIIGCRDTVRPAPTHRWSRRFAEPTHRRQPGPDPLRYPEFLRQGSTCHLRRRRVLQARDPAGDAAGSPQVPAARLPASRQCAGPLGPRRGRSLKRGYMSELSRHRSIPESDAYRSISLSSSGVK